MVQKFYSVEELWIGWENTAQETYIKAEETLIIAELLGTDTITVGIGEKNADTIYFLDWHMGLTPIASNINELLSLLVESRHNAKNGDLS